LFSFAYVGWLHSTANSAVFASETHRIREDNIFELQGNCGWVKMAYLGCA
jgi:hypothetical protein